VVLGVESGAERTQLGECSTKVCSIKAVYVY
jgi:hypothetical protein